MANTSVLIEGQNKAVTITPESSYKGGWGNIAYKIEKITYEPTTEQKVQLNKGSCWEHPSARQYITVDGQQNPQRRCIYRRKVLA